MKNYFKLAVLTAAIMSQSQLKAEYLVIYQLDPNGIIMEETAISGEAQLSPSTINRGQSTTLSWNYQYANSVDIKGLGIYGRSGSITLNSLASRNYEVEVIKGSQKKTENLFLTVIQPNQNILFNSDKLRVGLGDPITLNWNVENAEYVDIDNGVGNGLNLVGNSVVYPTLDTTFRLTAKGYDGVEDSNSYITIDVVNDSVINSFNSSSTNITKGNSITFNWDVTDSEGVILSPYGNVSGTPTGQQVVDFNTAGFYDFTLRTLSLSGREVVSTPIGINVYNPAVINSYTINGATSTVDVSPNEMMNIDWSTTDALSLKLNGNTVNGTSATLSAPSSVGTTNYVLEALNGAGDSVNSSISVNVVSLANIDYFNSPTTVFLNSPFNLSWSGTGVSRYELKSDNLNSGISTDALDLGSSTSSNVTPTASGSFTYTLSAYNTANSKINSTKTVVVENLPTFTGFTVNGQTSISVSPNAALTFAGSGFSTGAILQGRNSGNTANATNPSSAPATAGTYTYYAAATKTLNSIIKNSNIRSVSVTVVDAPTIGAITAPSNIFANSEFSMTWSGTNVVNYKIRGNVAASGVSTTDVDLGTTASRSITPTAAGTYTYTITATNAAGVTTTSTRVVTVEADPTFTGFTVNSGTSISVSPSAALTFAGAGFSTGAALQGRNSGNTADAVLPTTASATAGTYTYYASATKTLNSLERVSTLRTVSVTVVSAPTIGAITAPSNVFANSAFSMTWSGTDVVNYKIRGNIAASGVSTTDVDLGTTASRSITPTAAGTYIYTITATNAAGVTTTSTDTVIVEADPTFTGFTVNSGTSISVAPSAALTFAGAGFSTGAALQGRNSGNTANATLPTLAPATGGTYTYYAAATKTLNSVSKYSTVRAVTVIVENWVATTPTYTSWINSGVIYGCSNWSPDPSTVNSGVSFTQNANDCSQDQTRNRQNREQESTTLAIRNSGSVIVENQTLTNQSSSRTATGTKVNKVCLYDTSFSPNIYYWYTYNGGSALWSSGYQTVPYMWIDIQNNQTMFYDGSTPKLIAGLSKVSNLEYRYNDGNKIWKITRGAAISVDTYQICFE